MDVADCIGFIQKLKKEEFGAFYTPFGKLRDDANRFFKFDVILTVHRR